jgi:Protein of unknown function DUF262
MGELLYERAPTIDYLSDLVAQVIKGELLVPRLQREFVWTGEQRLKLFDSVLEGVPFGSIMVWRTRKVLRCYEGIGGVVLMPPPPEGSSRSYLLDGLQRLSTFVAALTEPTPGAETSGRAIGADEDWGLVYDLLQSEFALRSSIKPERLGACLPLTEVLATKRYLAFQRRLMRQLLELGLPEVEAERLVERADEVTSAIRSAKVPVISLATDDLQVATSAFQRINRQGTQMSDVHMVNALTYSENFDLLGRIEELLPQLAGLGWGELDPQTILHTCQALVGLSIYEGDPALISEKLREQPDVVDLAFDALVRAVTFLRDACGVAGPRLLPFNVLLVCLASVLHDAPVAAGDARKQRELAAWFWLSVYSRTPFGVSGGVDSLLEFVRDLAKGAKGVKWWGQAVDKVERLPKMMRLDASRVVTLVAQLCRLGPRTIKGEPVKEPHLLVARRGAEVLAPLLDAKTMKRLGLKRADKLTAVANRVLVEPEDLGALRDGLPGLPRKVLDSHAITPEAVEALKRKDVEGFFRLREEHLIALEQAFLDETRRTLARYL